MKNFFQKTGKKIGEVVVGCSMAVVGCVTALAAGEVSAGTSGVAITSDMLAPITNSITGNIGVILPVAIVIFGIMFGVGLVPTLIKKFGHKGN